MDLLRDWRRRTFGAAMGAVVAPTAIIAAAIAVGIGGGGLGGIRSIGQALSGPQLPQIAPAAPSDSGTADEAGRLLARVGPSRERRRAAAAALRRATLPGTGRDVGSSARCRPPAPARGVAPARPDGPCPAPAATAAPTATPAPARTPSPVRQLGDSVKSVTNQVPVAGQPAGQVVDLLVDTIDRPPRRDRHPVARGGRRWRSSRCCSRCSSRSVPDR